MRLDQDSAAYGCPNGPTPRPRRGRARYAQPHRGTVRFYRDNKGLEVDAIVEARDGRWVGVEVKLGHNRVDEAARNLLALRAKLSPEANAACGALLVLVADTPTYTRSDGVVVSSIASLGP